MDRMLFLAGSAKMVRAEKAAPAQLLTNALSDWQQEQI